MRTINRPHPHTPLSDRVERHPRQADGRPNHQLRAQLLSEAVVAGYIHDISAVPRADDLDIGARVPIGEALRRLNREVGRLVPVGHAFDGGDDQGGELCGLAAAGAVAAQ